MARRYGGPEGLSAAVGSVREVAGRIPSDTSDEARDHLVGRLRAMTPAQRALLADQLSLDVATIALAGIRAANPEMTEGDALRELARRRYGSVVADAASPQ